MSKFKKLLVLSGKIFLGMFLFYIIICIAVMPLAGPLVAKSQVKKLTGQNLRVGLIILNPFTWKLSINGLRLLDENDELLAGFDRFWVDVSFLSLLKKKIHIQSVGIQGMKVNSVMDAEGNINLLALVPEKKSQEQAAPGQESKNSETAEAKKTKTDEPKEMPDIAVDLFSFENGEFTFTDRSVDPNFAASLNDIDLTIKDISTDPDVKAEISLRALLDNKAEIINEALLNPFNQPLSMEMVFNLNNYVMPVLTPYVGKYTGRQAKSGKMDIKIEYRIVENKLDAKHKVKIKGFDFGDQVRSDDALKLPFSMVLALLEDAEDRIIITLPVSGDIKDPEFHYTHMIGQVAKNFFMKIVTSPFTALVSMAGSGSETEDYGYIAFSPGRAELSDNEKEKLKAIVKAFNERPGIAVKINKGYDALEDWKAIKTEVFEKDFKALQEETERPDIYVYERLYDRRFGMRAFWSLTRDNQLENGGYDFDKITAEVKRRLVEDGQPDKRSLEELAEKRADQIYQFMVAQGFAMERVSIAGFTENQVIKGGVPVSLELKIFSDTQQSAEE